MENPPCTIGCRSATKFNCDTTYNNRIQDWSSGIENAVLTVHKSDA